MFRLLILAPDFAYRYVLLEPLIEVRHASACVDDGEDNQHNSDDRKTRQVFPNREVIRLLGRLIHASQFEYEISQPTKEADDGDDHSKLLLSTGEESCHAQNENRNWDSTNSNPFLGIRKTRNDYQELNSKSKEEEEIEL